MAWASLRLGNPIDMYLGKHDCPKCGGLMKPAWKRALIDPRDPMTDPDDVPMDVGAAEPGTVYRQELQCTMCGYRMNKKQLEQWQLEQRIIAINQSRPVNRRPNHKGFCWHRPAADFKRNHYVCAKCGKRLEPLITPQTVAWLLYMLAFFLTSYVSKHYLPDPWADYKKAIPLVAIFLGLSFIVQCLEWLLRRFFSPIYRAKDSYDRSMF